MVFSRRSGDQQQSPQQQPQPQQEWSRFNRAPAVEREEAAAEDAPAAAPPAPTGPTVVGAPNLSPVAGIVRTAMPESDRTRLSRSLHSDGQDVETLIGERTTFNGTLRCEGAVRILGTVDGEIDSKGGVIIEERARVTAKVSAAQVTIAGNLEGEVHCTGRVEIRGTGRVQGELHAGTLIVQEGAVFDGNSRMGNAAEASA